MPFYPNEVIQQLKAQTDISLVIQQFIPLKKSGNGRFVGMCPFHDDHSPSMSVNPTIGIYKCFACGAGGDVFKFVQEHEKIDFNGSVEWVANFVGFPLPNFANKENAEITEERGMVRKLNELACEWFESKLSLSEKALAYLAKRNISEKIRKEFRIGYAPDGREGFIGYAAKNGFSPKDCVRAGLAIEKENGGIADKFRDRLIIAIQNLSGVVVAFGGRDLSEGSGAFGGNKRPKYLNSPDTALYSKSDILFGLNHSRSSIAKENAIIIVEGYFDLISLYQSGITNVVAASGTALTETHANILSRYAKTAYLVFDGDAAGRKATLRSLEILLPKGIAPRIFALSRADGTKIDPDNFINEQGAEAFRNKLSIAEDWLNYLSHEMPTNSSEDRANFVTYTKSIIKSIENSELRNQYLKLISERFNASRSLEHIKGIQTKHKPKVKQISSVPNTQNTPQDSTLNGIQAPSDEQELSIPWYALSPIEVRFANLIFRNPTLLERACEYFDMDFVASGIQILESNLIDEFVGTILSQYSETGYFSQQVLYDNVSPELKLFIEGLPEESWVPPNEIYEFYDSMMVLTMNLCTRYKKAIPLDSDEGFQLRLQLNHFIRQMEKLDKDRKMGAITIDAFADQIICSKSSLIQLHASMLM